ncbi:MAG: hypothetical protein M1830_009279 [Pleopsidium flavum]|nr:MAG: hypothetical protein M1830_001095 [Pleopsidium flavum]KAI9874796.1 MAG: hypothetical protein M1830_009279 [Pleopsidium flavum]
MKRFKDGHFGYIVGDLPIGDSDVTSWSAVEGVAGQLNDNCVDDPPRGKKFGGIQPAGQNLHLAVILFGDGPFHQLLAPSPAVMDKVSSRDLKDTNFRR